MTDFKTLALCRESCRAYQDTPVPAEVLEDIVRTSLLAPSARNLQPWHFHVCTGETANLEAGGYLVRLMASGNALDSDAQTIKITA